MKIFNEIKNKYVYTSTCKIFIYYNFSKKRICLGKAKLNLKNNKFIITTLCNKDVTLEKLTYNEFINKINIKDFESLNFKDKDIQKYYVFNEISKNKDIDNPNLSTNYLNLTEENLTLTRCQLSKIRNKIIDL